MSLIGLPRKRGTVVLRELGDEAMLYDPQGDLVVKLNPTARQIWEMCDGKRSPNEMVRALQESFVVSADAELEEDVSQAIHSFQTAGLLEQNAGA